MPPLSPFSRSCLALAISQLATLPNAHTATLKVNSQFDDDLDGCTLREAVVTMHAKANQNGCINQSSNDFGDLDTIYFGPGLSGYTLPLTQAAPLNITAGLALEIVGHGADALTIDGQDNTRIFYVSSAALSLSSMTITGGDFNAGNGGAIAAVYAHSLSLADVTLTENSAGGSGGAIWLHGTSSDRVTASISQSALSGNESGNRGGAIYASYASLHVADSIITENKTVGAGGGISASKSTLNMVSTTVSANSRSLVGGVNGAGVYSSNGDVTVLYSEFLDNQQFASAKGGGLFFSGATETLDLRQSMFSGNAATEGGGLFFQSGTGFIDHVDLIDNRASRGAGTYHLTGTTSISNVSITTDHTGCSHGCGIYAHKSGAGNARLTITSSTINNMSNNYAYGMGVFQGDGTVTIQNSTISGNTARHGGAVYIDAGTLDITDSHLTGHTANWAGGAIYANYKNSSVSLDDVELSSNTARRGGAIFARNRELLVTGSVLRNNTATGDSIFGTSGGAISFRAWPFGNDKIVITHSEFSGNRTLDDISPGLGGAIALFDANAEISNLTINGNSANYGGGLSATNSEITIVGSTLYGNRAGDDGGGIHISQDSGFPLLSVINSTLSGNSAGDHGGGLYSKFFSVIDLVNSTITANKAGTGGGIAVRTTNDFTLKNLLVSGNRAAIGAEIYWDGNGSFAQDGHNLLGDSANSNAQAFAGFTPGLVSDFTATYDGTHPTDLKNILGPLQDNGGPTRTHGLHKGSPALDAADSAICGPGLEIEFDQRGEPREAIACDIGAFEGIVEDSSCFVINGTGGKVVVFCL